MIDNLDDAIQHCKEKEEELKKQHSELLERANFDRQIVADCWECAREHEQLASWLIELKERREAVKKLEESAEYYKDSLFGDGILFALKVISEPKKIDCESEE